MSSRAVVTPLIRDVWHDSKRIHVTGKLVLTPGDYATELCVADLFAVSNEYRAVSSITDDLNLEASSATSNNALDLAPVRLDPTKIRTLTGSIDTPGGSNTVTGVGTKFLTELKVGDYLIIGTDTDGEIRKVTAIATNLSCTTVTQFSNLANDVAPGAIGPDGLIPISGIIDPVADPTVTGIKTHFLGYGLQFNLAADGPKKLSIAGQPVAMNVWGRTGYIYKIVTKKLFTLLTGTVDLAASVTQTGVGTKFTKELAVGDRWIVGPSGAAEERVIASIVSDTSLTVNRAHTNLANDTHPAKLVKTNKISDLLLQVWGLFGPGGAGAAGTKALYIASEGVTKEEAGNIVGHFTQPPTAALPDSVIDDDIDFEAIFKLVG